MGHLFRESQLNRQYSKTKLEAAQEDLWLAEIEREDSETLVITLAGPGRIIMFECSGLTSFALAHESLDPDVLPNALNLNEGFELSQVTEFDSDDEIAARLSEISADYAHDVLCASKHAWIDGDLPKLQQAPLLVDLRVESWRLEPQPMDLHLLIGCERIVLADENGEIDLKPIAAGAESKTSYQTAALYDAPQEPPYEVESGELPPAIESVIRSFFEAGIANDFATMAKLTPNFDRDAAEQCAYFSQHFHTLFDWGYARALDGWQAEGPLANVRIRGIIHSRAEDGIESINEECVWSFSLRRREDGWVIRNWATSWPSVGSAPSIPDEEKPWLERWKSGPVL